MSGWSISFIVIYLVISLLLAGAVLTNEEFDAKDLFSSIFVGLIWPIVVLIGIGSNIGDLIRHNTNHDD